MRRKDSDIKCRLIALAKSLGISGREFSRQIGKDPGYIAAITGEIGNETVKDIYINFPQMNLAWLITGEGDMFLPITQESTAHSEFITYLKEKISVLENENKKLIRENEGYKQQIGNNSKAI